MLIKSKGFSLIELMITIAIIGILSLIAIPAYNDYVKRTYFARTFQFLNQIGDEWLLANADGTMAGHKAGDILKIPTIDYLFTIFPDNRWMIESVKDQNLDGYQHWVNAGNLFALLANAPDNIFGENKDSHYDTSLNFQINSDLSKLITNYPKKKSAGMLITLSNQVQNISLNLIIAASGERYCTYSGYFYSSVGRDIGDMSYFPKICQPTPEKDIIPQL